MSAPEAWSTTAEIVAARERFEREIDGWVPPRAHGTALVPAGADRVLAEHFRVVNAGDHRLPAVVLAGVVGHRRGTAVHDVPRDRLAIAVRRLAPAEPYPGGHPNLWTWRDVYLPALDADPGSRVVAVYLGAGDAGDDEPGEGPAEHAPTLAAFGEALARAGY